MKEHRILSQVRDHPHFVRVLDFSIDGGRITIPNNLPENPDDKCASYRCGQTCLTDATCMSMELSEHGDFFDFIKNTGGCRSLPLVRFLFSQILAGVQHLNSIGYSHLDLKLDNILIGNDFKLKLCDFGFAKRTTKQIFKKYGTEGFMAPEVLMKDRYDTYEGVTADIFSLGVILFILYFGQPPFNKADDRNDRFYSLFAKKPESFFRLHPTIKRVRGEIDAEINQDLIELLAAMLSKEVAMRPKSVSEVLAHKFFATETCQTSEESKDSVSIAEQFKSLVLSQKH